MLFGGGGSGGGGVFLCLGRVPEEVSHNLVPRFPQIHVLHPKWVAKGSLLHLVPLFNFGGLGVVDDRQPFASLVVAGAEAMHILCTALDLSWSFCMLCVVCNEKNCWFSASLFARYWRKELGKLLRKALLLCVTNAFRNGSAQSEVTGAVR